MVRPERCASMSGSTALTMRAAPRKFVSIWSINSYHSVSCTAPKRSYPALLTSASMRPSRWSNSRTQASTEALLVMSRLST